MGTLSHNTQTTRTQVIDQLNGIFADAKHRLQNSFTATLTPPADNLAAYYEYLRNAQGKMLRSMALFASADATGGITDRHITAACGLELLHFASLIHDDIIDGASSRRGVPAVHIQYDTRTAVILGDLLIARGLHLFSQVDEPSLFGLITDAMDNIVNGELMQCAQSPVEPSAYFEIIERKTAILFGIAMYLGALLNNSPDADAWRCIGHHLGMAFQIMDDVADLRTVLAKPTISRADKRELFTLPVIVCLQSMSTSEKDFFLAQLHEPTEPVRKALYERLIKDQCMQAVNDYAQHYLTSAHDTMPIGSSDSAKHFIDRFCQMVISELYI